MMIRLVAFASLAVVSLAQGATWSGRAFLDTNGNGTMDEGEAPVPGCAISDERSIRLTDGSGRYQIELPPGPATLFVVNASNTWPTGAWWRHVPDGAKAGTHDFALRQETQEGPLYFVHGADTHFELAAARQYERYTEHVNSLPTPVRFVIHTGDLVSDAQRARPAEAAKLFAHYTKASAALKPDLRNVIGAHDLAGVSHPGVKSTDPDRGRGAFRRMIGPAHYAFRWGPYHFLALDSATMEGNTVRAGLTPESVDWAIQYLAGVATNEPVVVLSHAPMFEVRDGLKFPDDPVKRPHEIRLREELLKRKLLMTLTGGVHDRLSHGWARAPHLTGGAVSYAWQGERPHPPAPRGYVLYRLDGLQMERVFLDWAERDSIDLHLPDFKGIFFGQQGARGLVPDFDNSLKTVELTLGTNRVTARTAPLGKLSKAFLANLDSGDLADGVYLLEVKATFTGREQVEQQPVVVYNARPTKVQPKEQARLRFAITGELISEGRVLCNGRQLGVLPAGKYADKEFTFDIPADRVRRLNEIRITAEDRADFPSISARGVNVSFGRQSHRDVRFSPLEPRLLYPERTGNAAALTSYVDIEFRDKAMEALKSR